MNYAAHQATPEQLARIRTAIAHAMQSPFYRKKFAGFDPRDLKTVDDLRRLPFSDKSDLREAYPMGLAAVPEADIVRIHSSSGTTGTPVIIPYTQKDVDDWAIMFQRCYETAGVTRHDRIHITPGYGLWTAGIGFQNGGERLGALCIPMGPGNTDRQLKLMQDMKSTVLCATSSYALLLAEEIARRGIGEKIHLKKALIGSERWGEKMRRRIAHELGVELYDIYGLTEIYGPGIGISCDCQCGMHYFNDYIHCEIIDPHTGERLENGEVGELVITTLQKEGAPLINYRTHDLTRFLPGECGCGRAWPRATGPGAARRRSYSPSRCSDSASWRRSSDGDDLRESRPGMIHGGAHRGAASMQQAPSRSARQVSAAGQRSRSARRVSAAGTG